MAYSVVTGKLRGLGRFGGRALWGFSTESSHVGWNYPQSMSSRWLKAKPKMGFAGLPRMLTDGAQIRKPAPHPIRVYP